MLIQLFIRWYPSLTISVQWITPIPHATNTFAPRTVAAYARGSFINDPQGRHDSRVEIWSSPSELGSGPVEEGWRDKQVCMAIINSTALFVPGNLNIKLGAKL
jgi:hypothetical protein